jgi:hypothetical protein
MRAIAAALADGLSTVPSTRLLNPSHASFAAKRHEVHRPLVARLEPDRRRRRNVEMHAERDATIEHECAIHLEKMEMRADLNGSVACVANLEGPDRLVGVDDDRRALQNVTSDVGERRTKIRPLPRLPILFLCSLHRDRY